MPSDSLQSVPETRVISPSPEAPDRNELEDNKDGYFPSANGQTPDRRPSTGAANGRKVTKKVDHTAEPEFRARSRSRDDDARIRQRRTGGLTPLAENASDKNIPNGQTSPTTSAKTGFLTVPGTQANGGLAPPRTMASYWREFSRSPSPLGIIPIHREWRSFVHRHEIPRKALHVSIGFLALYLYAHNYQPAQLLPLIIGLLVPITAVDVLRHNWPPFNRFYIRCLGAFMRETEAHEKYNGVIWYLAGTLAVLLLYSKDIGVMCICLLSWCDTAASTFGRLYGRYTPRIRRGKSLAGSLAAFAFGIATSLMFWGWLGPRYEALGLADNTGKNAFAFTGRLALPQQVQSLFGLYCEKDSCSLSGTAALLVLSMWAGFVASASEAIDLFGLDDNITIPILCGIGLWAFLKVFSPA